MKKIIPFQTFWPGLFLILALGGGLSGAIIMPILCTVLFFICTPFWYDKTIALLPSYLLNYRNLIMTVLALLTMQTLPYSIRHESELQRIRERQKIDSIIYQKNKVKQIPEIPAIFSRWDGSCVPLVKAVKVRMHDPSSFDHTNTRYFVIQPGVYEVTMRYRGKNSFGAIVSQTITAEVTDSGEVRNVREK